MSTYLNFTKALSENPVTAVLCFMICMLIALLVLLDINPSHIPPWSSWYTELDTFSVIRLYAVVVPSVLFGLYFLGSLVQISVNRLKHGYWG